MSSNSSSPSHGKAVEELRRLYEERKEAIWSRLQDFKQILQRTEEELFAELCFCLLTPQSSAKACWNAVMRLREKGFLLKGSPLELEPLLNDVRFNDSKAKYIVQARDMFSKDGDLRVKSHITSFFNPYESRDWLVENVMGLGYKEASHFLRNIGLGEEFAILDRHILKHLVKNGVIPEVPKSITDKKYFEIENRMREFSQQTGIPMSHLDLLWWSEEAGEIFK